MAVASHRKDLPDELERMVFLLASRKPYELANYMRVAHRVKIWMEPILYKEISLASRARAENLLLSLSTRAKTVLYLYIDMSVPPNTVVMLLFHCPGLINFALRGSGNGLRRFHVILNALNSIKSLRYLSVDPAAFFQTHFVHLPDTPAFHRVTHLDLTANSGWKTVASGFQYLKHLSHLSMTWKMSRTATHGLLALLQRRKFKLILLWLDEIEGQPMATKGLLKRGLDDPRIVLLCRASKGPMELSGGFWRDAKRIITWRKENNVTTVERPTVLEDITSIYAQTLD